MSRPSLRCCSTRRTATPSSAAARSTSNSRRTIIGASPWDSSSARITSGFEASTRPTTSICCSPPETRPALTFRRRSSSGKCSNAICMSPLPRRRFSSTERPLTTQRPSVINPSPCRTRRWRGRVDAAPLTRTRPLNGLMAPANVMRVVVLPAPLRPARRTTCPAYTSRSMSRTAASPRYPEYRPSHESIVEVIRLRFCWLWTNVGGNHTGIHEYFVRFPYGDAAPKLHHDHLVCDSSDEVQVVFDDDHGSVRPFGQVANSLGKFLPFRDVQ